MLAKSWKKICIAILIIACLFNIITKLVHRVSLNKEMISSATYMLQHQDDTKNETK